MQRKRQLLVGGTRRLIVVASVLSQLGAWGLTLASDLTPMRMANSPTLSADGAVLAFEWCGDIWVGSPYGGEARRLTASPAYDSHPVLSPDGRRIAFRSDRSGSRQVYVVPTEGGMPRQVTTHSEGSLPLDWSPDGGRLLTVGSRDHHWKQSERLFYVDPDGQEPEQLVVDAYAERGGFEGDSGRLLVTRLGTSWWRQGYRGSQAAQAWRYDPEAGSFERLVADRVAVRHPMWRGQNETLLFLSNEPGPVFNLFERDREGNERQLTQFSEGALASPALAEEAGVVVFRHLFDFYRLNLDSAGGPEKISLVCRTDTPPGGPMRRLLREAEDVAFSGDGLEVAMIAGADLWVMDTVLREPTCVVQSPGGESDPEFSPDGTKIAYVSRDPSGQPDLWLAAREDPEKYWWQSRQFTRRKLTDDAAGEVRPSFSPEGDRIAFAGSDGVIRVIDLDGVAVASINTGWDTPDFCWSPDGEYFAYATRDSDYNRDVFIVASDGSGTPVNVSQHPDDDRSPAWSPDGSMLAYIGSREEDVADLFVAHLDGETPSRRYDRVAEAIDTMQSRRGAVDSTGTESAIKSFELPKSKLNDLVVRIREPGVSASSPFWSPDSKQVAFTGRRAEGGSDTFVAGVDGDQEVTQLSGRTGSQARWIDDETIVWMSGDTPGKVDAKSGDTEAYTFRAYQAGATERHHAAVFLECWRRVRDTFYDSDLHGADWAAVRDRYLPIASEAIDGRALTDVVRMMLGELNASHQGFTRFSESHHPEDWAPRTAHLGAWFEPSHDGSLEVTRATRDAQRAGLRVGARVSHVEDREVRSVGELNAALTGAPDRAVRLRVDGEEELSVLPISYSRARDEVYREWVEDRAAQVDRLSGGRFGYLHIRSMGAENLRDAERDLFAATSGRDGLVVDVRFNGGGWIADRLLHMLSHPDHAVTNPRDGEPGYPHSRRAYPTWTGPLVALCNEASFSNAEIFSHAIKSTGRGRLIGKTTAGGVISTYSREIMGFGRLRITQRGWRVRSTGENMEGNGAVPDLQIDALPGEMSRGVDRQLEAAVKSLLEDLDA